MKFITEVAQVARYRGSEDRSQKGEGAVVETRCKTPRLRPNAVRKRGSEIGEAMLVAALAACSFGNISVANAERGTSEAMSSRLRAVCSLFECVIKLRRRNLREPSSDVSVQSISAFNRYSPLYSGLI
jgi:hypothetical protein